MRDQNTVTRRNFLLGGTAVTFSLALPGWASARVIKSHGVLKSPTPRKALVLWYSQTGHTERYGRLIARSWEKQGLTVDTRRLHWGEKPAVAGYDLIAVGTPVQYLDVPQNVQDWLASLPSIKGTGVASFVSYGGTGDGQHNAAVSLLGALTDRGGIPLGFGAFGNMSTYPPTWSLGNEGRILKFRTKPDQATYAQVRAYADAVLGQYGHGQAIEAHTTPSFSGLFKGGVSRGISKLMVGHHVIDTTRCIRCGTCVRTCPVGAIDITLPRIDTHRCLLCFGCVNNCPVGAHDLTVLGKPVYGFPEFLRRNNITILDPPELET